MVDDLLKCSRAFKVVSTSSIPFMVKVKLFMSNDVDLNTMLILRGAALQSVSIMLDREGHLATKRRVLLNIGRSSLAVCV